MLWQEAEGRQQHGDEVTPERARQVVEESAAKRKLLERQNSNDDRQKKNGQAGGIVNHMPIPARMPLTENLGPFTRKPPRCAAGSMRKMESKSTHSKAPEPQ